MTYESLVLLCRHSALVKTSFIPDKIGFHRLAWRQISPQIFIRHWLDAALGCLEPGCALNQTITGVGDESASSAGAPMVFTSYPAPFSEQLFLGARLGAHIPSGAYTLSIYDGTGRLAEQRAFDPNLLQTLDTQGWSSGLTLLYIYKDGVPFQVIKSIKR